MYHSVTTLAARSGQAAAQITPTDRLLLLRTVIVLLPTKHPTLAPDPPKPRSPSEQQAARTDPTRLGPSTGTEHAEFETSPVFAHSLSEWPAHATRPHTSKEPRNLQSSPSSCTIVTTYRYRPVRVILIVAPSSSGPSRSASLRPRGTELGEYKRNQDGWRALACSDHAWCGRLAVDTLLGAETGAGGCPARSSTLFAR